MIQKLTRTIVRTFAFVLALCATTSAWATAPTATAVWQTGEFADASHVHGGYSISLNGSTINASGNIVINGSKRAAATINLTDVTAAGETKVTLLYKYKTLTTPTDCRYAATICYKDSSKDYVYDMGFVSWSASNRGLLPAWHKDTSSGNFGVNKYSNDQPNYTAPMTSDGGYVVFSYDKSTSTISGWQGATIEAATGGSKDGYAFSGYDGKIAYVGIGGPTGQTPANKWGAWGGLEIEKVAIFVGNTYSTADLESYTWPDLTAEYEYVATINSNTTLSDITEWTKGTGTPGTEDDVYITIENNAVLTISGPLDIGSLKVIGGSITLADGASVSSTPIGGADINIAASTEVTISNSDISSKIICNGKLITNGDTEFSNSGNNFAYGSEIYVATGTTTVNAYFTTTYTSAGRGLHGNITIAKDAKFVNSGTEVFDCNADANHPIVVDVSGTLSLGSTRWTLGNNNKIVLHEGGRVEGDGDSSSNGAFDLENNVTGFTIEADGNAEFAALVRIRDTATLNVDVAAGKTLTFSTKGFVATTGKLKKTGDGTLENTINSSYTGLTTVSAGKIVSTAFPSGAVSIGKDGTFTLQNCDWTSGSGDNDNRFSGTGTLELKAMDTYHTYSAANSFGGTLKFATSTSAYIQYSASFANISGTPEMVLECGTESNQKKWQFGGWEDGTHSMNVKNLSGFAQIYPDFNQTRAFAFNTLQTKNTTFSGTFTQYSDSSYPTLVVRGENEADSVYSLTLTKANTTTGSLTVQNNAKVVFSSTGSWAAGTVTVASGGVLESQNSDDVAATLVVEKGATLKFADGVALAATAYDWSDVAGELENSEKITIDLSDVTPASEVTLIASGVTIDASKFKLGSAKYGVLPTLSVVNNALKATYPDNLCVDGAWLTGPTANQPAYLLLTTTSTTLTTATELTLGTVSVYNMSGASATLTTAGAGELTFGGLTFYMNSVTLNVGSDVTFAGAVSGTATINVVNGGELTIDGVTCDKQITVQSGGKLYTKGTTTLSSSANVFYYGSEFEVVDGTTTLTTATAGLKGNITIDGNATLTVGATGGINSAATALEPTELHVYGSLNMSSYRWVFRENNALYFYTGCTFTGEGPNDGFGPLEIYSSHIYVRPNGDTTGTVTLPLETVFRRTTPVDVADNMNLTISGYLEIGYQGDAVGFTKTGAGDFTLTPSSYNNTINFVASTVSAGRMIMTSMPMFPSVVIEDGATFTLKDTEWTSGNVFSGTGILELYSATVSKTHTITGSTFGGTLKLSNVPVPGSNPPTWQNNINPSGSAMFDSSVRPEFVCDSTATHLGSGYYKSDSTKIEVRNLSGAGSLRAQWTSSSDCHYTIETKQTKATAFTGTIAAEDGDPKTGGGKYTRYINLSVIGDDSETPNSLTITQRQNTSGSDSSQALSTLTVSDNAKVIFGENGGWGYGHVVVGDDGYLECTNNAAVKKLTLNDGANIVFPTSSSSFTDISSITFASGTVTILYPSGVTPTSGTKLINWSAAPAGSFVFDNGSTVKQFGGDYYMLESESTGLYIRKAVAVDNLASQTPKFYSSVEGALDENNVVYLIAAPDESVTLPVGKTISNQMGVSTSNFTVNPTTAEYTVPYANNSYTVANAAVTYYWAGADGGDWGTRSNWKVAAADGPDATRDMETTDSVAFNNGASVTRSADMDIVNLTVNGAVTFKATDRYELRFSGSVSGNNGTLTLDNDCLKNISGAEKAIPLSINFINGARLAGPNGNAMTITGNVSVRDKFEVWGTTHIVQGNLTVANGSTIQTGASGNNGALTVTGTTTLNGSFTKTSQNALTLGNVIVAANVPLTIAEGGGTIVLNGAVTVQPGVTLTIPASGVTVGDSASFVLGGKSSVLVDNGSGASGKVSTSMTDGARVVSTTSAGVTTYKVGYGSIFSVY